VAGTFGRQAAWLDFRKSGGLLTRRDAGLGSPADLFLRL
jgi:hypothetical protein